jgi:hypothetical protein
MTKLNLNIGRTFIEISEVKIIRNETVCDWILCIDDVDEFVRVYRQDIDGIRLVKKEFIYKYVRQYNRICFVFLNRLEKLKQMEYNHA